MISPLRRARAKREFSLEIRKPGKSAAVIQFPSTHPTLETYAPPCAAFSDKPGRKIYIAEPLRIKRIAIWRGAGCLVSIGSRCRVRRGEIGNYVRHAGDCIALSSATRRTGIPRIGQTRVGSHDVAGTKYKTSAAARNADVVPCCAVKQCIAHRIRRTTLVDGGGVVGLGVAGIGGGSD